MKIDPVQLIIEAGVEAPIKVVTFSYIRDDGQVFVEESVLGEGMYDWAFNSQGEFITTLKDARRTFILEEQTFKYVEGWDQVKATWFNKVEQIIQHTNDYVFVEWMAKYDWNMSLLYGASFDAINYQISIQKHSSTFVN